MNERLMDSWPSEIRLNPEKTALHLTFRNGLTETLPAEILRVTSPSAEVQGHSPSERKLVPGMRNVSITGIDQVGNYAIRLHFSDGHNTGIYTWHFLFDLAQRKDEVWNGYLRELDSAGLSRDR